LKRVKHYNKPKQYKKYTTFRRKQTDASTLISANNSHDSDNLTINRLSHLFKKTLKTYIPKYELSRLIKKYKNKRRGNKYVMRGGKLPANLEQLIKDYKDSTDSAIKEVKLGEIKGLITSGFTAGADSGDYKQLISNIYAEPANTEEKTKLLTLINPARVAEVNSTVNPEHPQSITQVQAGLSQSSQSGKANEAGANQPEVQATQPVVKTAPPNAPAEAVQAVQVADSNVVNAATQNEGNASVQAATDKQSAEGAAAGVPETQVKTKESQQESNPPPTSSANEELDDDVIESEVIELKDASSCKDLLTALLNDREFSYVTVSKRGSEEQIKNKTNFIIGAIRYGRIPKKEESATTAAAVPAEPAAEKSILDFTKGESVSVAAGDPIIKGDGVFINTPIDGTFNDGTADNIDIAGIDKGKFGTITSKRVYKKGKQIERTEDIPKDVTFDDIRVEVNFPPDITEESPDLTQYLYNFSANTSVKIKQTQESCAAFLEKNKDDDKESTKEKMKKVAALLPKIISQPSKFEKFKKLLSDKFTGGIVGFKELFKKREIPLPPEVIDGLKEQTEDSENCTIGATSPDPVTLTVTTNPDGTVSIKSSSGPSTLPGLLDSLAKKEEDKDGENGSGGEDGKNTGASSNDTSTPANKGKSPAGAGEDEHEQEANNDPQDVIEEDASAVVGEGSLDENASSNVSVPSKEGNSLPAAPEPPGKSNVPVRPKNTAALLQRENDRKAAQTADASAKESQMKSTAVTNITSNTGPIRPEANKPLTEYKTIFDNVEKTVNGYLNYDVGKTESDQSDKQVPSYPLTSFALVFNNNFNWKENVANQEYPISPYNLQSKLPALTRIYETRRKLYDVAKKIIAKVNEYVTKIIDEKIRIGDAEGTKTQRALLSEIQKLLQTSEFNDATNKQEFINRVKKDLGLNINDFYMNEIWTNFIKPYGDLKRFVEAIINTNSIIRKQIDGFIKQNKASNLDFDKQRSTEILTQIENILDNVNTQNGIFNDNILAIAFDLLFLPALFKRKDIATSGLGKSKEEYEKIIKLLVDGDEKINPRYIGINTRISEFFRILDAKNKIVIGFKKLSIGDNRQIIDDFKRLLCDDIAKQLFYSTDIGKNLPPGELKQNILTLFKLIRDSFEKECAECSTLLNCSGPKLQTFLEKSKEIKGLLNGLRGGIIGSVNREISDLESKINNVIKSAAFTFNLYGATSTFNEVNFDIIKDKLSRTKIEDVTAKLQSDVTTENTENTNPRLAIYANALKNFQDILPSFTVKAFNGVTMKKTSDAFRSATIEQRRQELKAQELEQQAKHELDLQKMKELTIIANAAAAAPPNPTSGVSAAPATSAPATNLTSGVSAAPAPSPNTAVPDPAAGSTAAAPNTAVPVDVDDDHDLEVVHVDDEVVHVGDVNVKVNGPTDISIPTISPAASSAASPTASPTDNKFGIVGGKTRRNNPKTKNKQTRKQNKVIYRIPHKSSSYKSKIGTTNSAKSKNTRKHK
jgi:hypothetical protein